MILSSVSRNANSFSSITMQVSFGLSLSSFSLFSRFKKKNFPIWFCLRDLCYLFFKLLTTAIFDFLKIIPISFVFIIFTLQLFRLPLYTFWTFLFRIFSSLALLFVCWFWTILNTYNINVLFFSFFFFYFAMSTPSLQTLLFYPLISIDLNFSSLPDLHFFFPLFLSFFLFLFILSISLSCSHTLFVFSLFDWFRNRLISKSLDFFLFSFVDLLCQFSFLSVTSLSGSLLQSSRFFSFSLTSFPSFPLFAAFYCCFFLSFFSPVIYFLFLLSILTLLPALYSFFFLSVFTTLLSLAYYLHLPPFLPFIFYSILQGFSTFAHLPLCDLVSGHFLHLTSDFYCKLNSAYSLLILSLQYVSKI